MWLGLRQEIALEFARLTPTFAALVQRVEFFDAPRFTIEIGPFDDGYIIVDPAKLEARRAYKLEKYHSGQAVKRAQLRCSECAKPLQHPAGKPGRLPKVCESRRCYLSRIYRLRKRHP